MCAVWAFKDRDEGISYRESETVSSYGYHLKPVPLPAVSCASKGLKSDLHPEALILSGPYKNDLRTRNFVKDLVGEHFHFTAAGIDWIRACWERGKPPTYKEFADWWQAEYAQKDTRALKKRVGISPLCSCLPV